MFGRTDAVLSPRRPSTDDPLLDALKRSDSASETLVSPSLSLSQMYPCSELDWLPLALTRAEARWRRWAPRRHTHSCGASQARASCRSLHLPPIAPQAPQHSIHCCLLYSLRHTISRHVTAIHHYCRRRSDHTHSHTSGRMMMPCVLRLS